MRLPAPAAQPALQGEAKEPVQASTPQPAPAEPAAAPQSRAPRPAADASGEDEQHTGFYSQAKGLGVWLDKDNFIYGIASYQRKYTWGDKQVTK